MAGFGGRQGRRRINGGGGGDDDGGDDDDDDGLHFTLTYESRNQL